MGAPNAPLVIAQGMGDKARPSVTMIIPTLERPSLFETIESLNAQTRQFDDLILETGKDDPVSKIKKALEKVNTEFIAIGDDDIIYPPTWLESALEVIQLEDKIAFVSGAMLPMSKLKGGNNSELCISEVSSTWFGTTNMSQRVKLSPDIEERDETNLQGAGLCRTEVVKEIFAKDNVIPSFHDTWMLFRMKQLGYKTMYSPGCYFYHSTRKSLYAYMKQMLRCGSGRMGFFKRFPFEAIKKFYILGPIIFLFYLPFSFWFPTPLLIYLALVLCASFLTNNHKSWKLPLYFIGMHLSYGVGQFLGLFRSIRRWR